MSKKFQLFCASCENFREKCNPADNWLLTLDVAIVNLKEANCTVELGDGMLYIKLQQKLPAARLASYHRWLFETHKLKCVEIL